MYGRSPYKFTPKRRESNDSENGEVDPRLAELKSRETMFRFYSKDPAKFKRLETPGYIGLDAYMTFYKKYKRLGKEREEATDGYSASTAFLSKCHDMKLVPKPVGLLNHRGPVNSVLASNKKLGQQYALALSKSMKHLHQTTNISL